LIFNFDQFNHAIHKEKEMADFRRISVLAALVLLLATAASAQLQTQAFSCTANAAVPPSLRSEGVTELVGDIVLQCTGGVPTVSGAPIPQVNFSIFTNAPITSRLYSTTLPAPSEALLLVDEPGTNTNASQLRECLTPLTGCTLPGIGVIDGSGNISPGPLPGPYNGVVTGSGSTLVRRNNVYRGVVSGNQVQFIGVPVDAPGTAGFRIFRFTNIRVNANAAPAGASGVPGQVLGFVSATGSTSVPINNPQQIVGFVQSGMTFTARPRGDVAGSLNQTTNIAFAQCNGLSRTSTVNSFILQFTENFPSAFKLRASAGQQNIPGNIWNTESGFYNTDAARGDTLGTTGIADFGTRLKAIFNNIPNGVTVYASLTSYPLATTGPAALASLVAVETGAFLPATATFTDLEPPSALVGGGVDQSAYVLPQLNNSATAVWEVIGADPLRSESYNMAIWFSYSAAPQNNLPAAVTTTVAGSFAPTGSAAGGTAASATGLIPRFVETSTGSRNILNIYLCRTNLLFPYVTNVSGFETGLAVVNTSLDGTVFRDSTEAQSGICTLFQFGDNANPSKATPTIAGGKFWAIQATDPTWFAQNFTGYVIAQCQFQFAHGFAFISDRETRNFAMGYLALVIPEPGLGGRSAGPGSGGSSGSGEALMN
jgi:hypothetical protein